MKTVRLAALAEVSVPTGNENRNLGSGEVEVTIGALATAAVAHDINAHGRAALYFDEIDNFRGVELALALDWTYDENISLQVAIDGLEGDDVSQWGVGPGVVYRLHGEDFASPVQIGAGMMVGLSSDAPDLTARISIGTTF